MEGQKPSPIQALEQWVANALGICLWVMAFALSIVVLLRHGFDYGATWLNDAAIYLLATVSLLGLGHTYQQDRHVRLDIFYSKMTKKGQIWINLIGNLTLLMPFCCFLIYSSFDYVTRSWQVREGSGEAESLGGLFLIKTMLLIGPAILILYAFLQCIRFIQALQHDRSL